MNEVATLSAIGALAAAGLAWSVPRAVQRVELSLAKHRSMTGHARIAKRVAALIPGYAYDEQRFFASDDAPPDAVARRRAGLARLAEHFATHCPRSLAATA